MPRSRSEIQADIDAACLRYRLIQEEMGANLRAHQALAPGYREHRQAAANAAWQALQDERTAKREAIRTLTVELKAAELADGVPPDVVRDTIRHQLVSKDYV